MSFKEKDTHNHKSYSIALKSKAGNTVGFINLSNQFIKAVTGKQPETLTPADIEHINKGDFTGFIHSLELEVSGVEISKDPIDPNDF